MQVIPQTVFAQRGENRIPVPGVPQKVQSALFDENLVISTVCLIVKSVQGLPRRWSMAEPVNNLANCLPAHFFVMQISLIESFDIDHYSNLLGTFTQSVQPPFDLRNRRYFPPNHPFLVSHSTPKEDSFALLATSLQALCIAINDVAS